MGVIDDVNALKTLRDDLHVGLARTLRRDECGDPMLAGKRGHVYADGQGYLIVVHAGSKRRWNIAKQRLTFARLTQDGDEEGCLRLEHRPTAEQSAAVRAVLGLPKRRPPPSHGFGKNIIPEGVSRSPVRNFASKAL